MDSSEIASPLNHAFMLASGPIFHLYHYHEMKPKLTIRTKVIEKICYTRPHLFLAKYIFTYQTIAYRMMLIMPIAIKVAVMALFLADSGPYS